MTRKPTPNGKHRQTISREKTVDGPHGTLAELPIQLIDAHPDNPRDDWDLQELPGLTSSVRQAGILQPVVVRPLGDRFQLVAGERRLRAAQAAKWSTVPAVVRRDMNDSEARAAMLHENLQRKGLNPIEKAKLLQKICSPVEEGGDGMTMTDAARLCGGRKHVWASNLIRLLRLPAAWRERIARGEIAERRARLLVAYAESPEVLSAVERDMAVNPWAWNTDESFERSLSLIAADPAAAGKQQEHREPKPPRAPASTVALHVEETTTELGDEPEPAVTVRPGDGTETICAAIARLSMFQLHAVQKAIDARRAEIEQARGRLGKRGGKKS